MINRQRLLNDLQGLLRSLEADLLERSESAEVPEVAAALKEEYEKAKKAERTALNYEDWRSDYITQIAAAWVLSCVFVRFLEDNRLVDPPKISGPTGSGQSSGNTDNCQLTTDNSRLDRARDEHTMFFQDRERATQTDREYLFDVFGELAKLPGAKEIFGQHNPVWQLPNWLSGDAAGELLRFFQRIDADTGTLVHDFTDPQWDTRFLGDLYQDLSQAARKKYALLQTPEFVEEFILDRTLDPALDEFGLVVSGQSSERNDGGSRSSETDNCQLKTENCFRMIDPACGSGHFLLGAFPRIFDRWCREDPGAKCRVVAQRTLDSIYGVDLNPFAVAIARFRLLLEALKACGVLRLSKAPAFELNLACGDSLLHGTGEQRSFGWRDVDHVTYAEDINELRRILVPGRYHAVVANPPYVTVKDKSLNAAYRERYTTCFRKYHLSVPFLERLMELTNSTPTAGFVGVIMDDQFMKQQFGKKLVTEFLATRLLTHVISTAGAYIPGHGTPTVILFLRNCPHTGAPVRTVMSIQGEPGTPEDPSQGQVWRSIVEHVDLVGSVTQFVSVTDLPRERLRKHPWSLGGGGASEVKETIDSSSGCTVDSLCQTVGYSAIVGLDEIYVAETARVFRRRAIQPDSLRPFSGGDRIRHWMAAKLESCIYPHDAAGGHRYLPDAEQHLWVYRTPLSKGRFFGATKAERGKDWREFAIVVQDKLFRDDAILYASVATHAQFAEGPLGVVRSQSGPCLLLPAGQGRLKYAQLLGFLNSSVVCFYLKQTCHNKGSTVDQHGARQRTAAFEDFFDHSATRIRQIPAPQRFEECEHRGALMMELACTLAEREADSALSRERPQLLASSALAGRQYRDTLFRMISLQEEIDWQCYHLYGLLSDDLTIDKPPPIELGKRAFEIVLARRMAHGETDTTWFNRHNTTPITDLPDDWPEDYRDLVERRIALIETDKNIGLIEQPEYKRRWNTEPWESQVERALREWLLDRLESFFDFDGRMNDDGTPTAKFDVTLTTVARLADVSRHDPQFMEVGELYRDDAAFDVQRLVEELVTDESVPLLPVLRYKAAGLRKRAEWEKTWELQRAEDAIDARTKLPADDPDHLTEINAEALKRREVGDIPVPPKYKSSDFLKGSYWRLRGKLDVPKERWVSFPHCEGEDGTLVIAWAGYDHLQLARVISAYYVDVQERLGGRDDPRLVPLLACLIELLPWLKQWHNEIDPEFGMAMGDYFEGFIQEEARNMPKTDGSTGWTLEEISGWEPPKKTGGRGRRKK